MIILLLAEKPFEQLFHCPALEAIDDFQPVALALDDADGTHFREMLRNRRLRRFEALLHVRHIAAAALPKPARDAEAHGMRERLEHLGRACKLSIFCHRINSKIVIFIYYDIAIYMSRSMTDFFVSLKAGNRSASSA